MQGLYRQVRRISEIGPKGCAIEFVVWQGCPEEWVETYTHFRYEEKASVMERFETPVPGMGWVRIDTPEWVYRHSQPSSFLRALVGVVSSLRFW